MMKIYVGNLSFGVSEEDLKGEFAKFGDVLDKVGKQLNTASRTIEQTGVRSRALERKLRSVEQLPEGEASAILALPDGAIPTAEEDRGETAPEDEATNSGEQD